MPVGEVQILIPVVIQHVVLTGADVVAEATVHRSAHRRPHLCRQPARAEQPVDRLRRFRRGELALRIRVPVILRTTDVDRPRCDEGNQQVLVEG